MTSRTRYAHALLSMLVVLLQNCMPGIAGRPLRRLATVQTAKPSIADSGASLIAGQPRSSSDAKLLHTFGAGRKLFGGVHLTGSIGETAQDTPNKSIGIGFNHSW